MKNEAILYVNLWNSRCGNCNKGADPMLETHEFVYGYSAATERDKTGVQPPGCGAKFVALGSDYIGASIKEWGENNRPDLPWIGEMQHD